MAGPSTGQEERLRLAELESYRILDTPPEDLFDRLTRLAAAVCGTPMATLTLIDERRQWFKSRIGTDVEATDRTHAFSAVCIAQRRTLVVPDATQDPLFADNPFVTGPPGIRFYAGVPLISPAGFALGTVSVMGQVPHQLDAVQRETLEMLARQAMMELELRRQRLTGPADAPAQRSVADKVRGLLHDLSLRKAPSEHEPAGDQRRSDLAIQIGIVRLQQEIASSALDLQAVLDLMAERACAFAGGSGAQLVLRDGEVLVCRAAAGTLAGVRGLPLSQERSLSAYAMRSGEALVCADTLTDPRVDAEACKLTGTRSLAVAPLYEDERVIGALVVGAGGPGLFSERDLVHLQVLAASLGATVQRHRIAEQLRSSDAQYRLLFDRNPHPMWVYETAGLRVLAANRAAVLHYGYSTEEFLSLHADALWADDSGHTTLRVQASPGREDQFNARRQHRRKDGSLIDVEVSAGTIDFNGQPARLVTATDVTERVRADRELARLSRAQRMLRACNETLVRGGDEATLLQTICRISVEIGGYRMAWVGFALDDAQRSVQPTAWAGEATDYLQDAYPSWSEQTPAGQGAIGRSIREGRTLIVDDMQEGAAQHPWRERVLHYGFRGAVCLPLRTKERSFGVLCLYTADNPRLGADEVQLLEDLADDLAFGIGHLRAADAQQRVQTAVLKVAAAVSMHSGREFFQRLAHHTADALGASGSFVSRLLPGAPQRARTIAAVVDGRDADNFDYPVAGSPCALLQDAAQVVITQDVMPRFPEDAALATYDVQAYVGLRLDNSAGEHLGQLFVLFREPLKDAEFVVPTLRIFAARAAGEMERQDADAQIRNQASLLDQAQDAIIVRSIDHRVLYWNRSAARLYGWTAEEALGRSLAELLYEDPSAFVEATNTVLAQDEWRGEILQRCKDGSRLQVEGHWTLVRDEDGQPQSILAINTDITQRKAAERRIHTLAFYDLLTGLPNRLLLADQLEQALATSAHSGMGGALLFIDLDNFKTLNDTVGHERGDRMLEQVAARLSANVRGVDTVARLGGDEFVVMLEALSEQPQEVVQQARNAGEKLLSALSAPYQLGEHVHRSTASIGIAVFTGMRDSVGELLKQADIAMYQAKGAGRNTLRFFDPGLQAALTARTAFEADLRLALLEQQLLLHYQPQSDADDRVSGVEALVRWQHPQRGLVSPAEFIPLAEETGLIVQLGRVVLREACALLATWADRPATAQLSMSVNVSASQFRHPDFVAHVVTELDRSGADPTRLKIELTESLMVDDMDVTIAKMDTLRARGVRFSLDDFGTGYSSLSYLKRLPLDQLKIDQSFVRDIMADANDTAIVQTIITLGRSLGLGVIAEGVETEGQRAFLAHHGCTAYQGYLFSRPLPADQLDAFLLANAGLQGSAAPV